VLVASAVAAALLGGGVLSNAHAHRGGAIGSGPRALPRDVLPDLRVEPSETVKLAAVRGSRKLRFSTDVTNLGPGPLELRPRNHGCRRAAGPRKQRTAYQSIRQEGGGRRHARAGCMVYHSHHGHWHFERFVDVQLRRASDGRLVARRHKVSFCLEDSHLSPRVPEELADKEHYSGCGPDSEMGISAGWTDHYDADVSGQSIDVRGVQPGRYRLVLRADPENRLLERNERNNHAAVTLSLGADAVRQLQGPAAEQ
jgi:hypothetical protein